MPGLVYGLGVQVWKIAYIQNVLTIIRFQERIKLEFLKYIHNFYHL